MTSRSLSPELLRKIDGYWRAANYFSVGQIYMHRGARRAPDAPGRSTEAPDATETFPRLVRHYINKHGQDMPEIRLWKWDKGNIAQSGTVAAKANAVIPINDNELGPTRKIGFKNAAADFQRVVGTN